MKHVAGGKGSARIELPGSTIFLENPCHTGKCEGLPFLGLKGCGASLTSKDIDKRMCNRCFNDDRVARGPPAGRDDQRPGVHQEEEKELRKDMEGKCRQKYWVETLKRYNASVPEGGFKWALWFPPTA